MPAQADTLRLHFGKLDVLDVHGFVADAGDDELFFEHLAFLGVEDPLAVGEHGNLLVRRTEVAQVLHGELRRLGDGRQPSCLRGGSSSGGRRSLPRELLLPPLRWGGGADRGLWRWRRIHEPPGIAPRLGVRRDVVEARHLQHGHPVTRTGRVAHSGGPRAARGLFARLRSGGASGGGGALVRSSEAQQGTEIVPAGEGRQAGEDDQQRFLPRAAVHESPPVAGGREVEGRLAGVAGTAAAPSSAVIANSVESVRSILSSGPSVLLPTLSSSMAMKEREVSSRLMSLRSA